ncbi:cytochrome P450 4V2 [Echria macrotheca]|uniref:Cytochrome P450 4V2 n=1 Tax=Echria macrotheca TaxID=438768 RepID=A0AAJ0BI06_9PEZI|nr:cytochrome P450 4V2 [Echria macrotheca]
MFPIHLTTLASLGAGYLLSSGRIPDLPRVGFFVAFTATWLLQLLVWFAWAVILYPRFFSPLRHLPLVQGGSWYNGQWKVMVDNPTGKPQIDWINSVPNDGIIRYLGPLNAERLMITSPKALAEVLTTKSYDFEKPQPLRYFLGHILGFGLFFSEGNDHRVQRRKLMPAFSFRHTKDLYPVFWSKSRECVQAMMEAIKSEHKPSVPGGEDRDPNVVEIGGWASRATLDIIGVAGMGRDFEAIKNPNNELSQTYQRIFRPDQGERILGFLGQFLPGWFLEALPIKRNSEIHQAARYIRATCADMIREKKQKLARKEFTGVDILSVALESGGFDDENLIDQIMTFLLAGHETTASSMTWAIYLLAKYPHIQTKLRNEIRERLPPLDDSDGDGAAMVSSMDIDKMPYLNAVCSEVLRYIAPVPILSRDTACNTTIQGHFVPKGTRIILSPWAINKSTAMWGAGADQFDPERWIAKSEQDRHAANGGAESNYAFMTFLHGPRSCIGREFARAEFACLLASWVGRFEFEVYNKEDLDEDKIEIKGGITARPAKGMHIKLTALDGW